MIAAEKINHVPKALFPSTATVDELEVFRQLEFARRAGNTFIVSQSEHV